MISAILTAVTFGRVTKGHAHISCGGNTTYCGRSAYSGRLRTITNPAKWLHDRGDWTCAVCKKAMEADILKNLRSFVSPDSHPTTLLTVQNNHIASCGVPPHFTVPAGGYLGFFTNQHDEQWIFIGSADRKVGHLWGGDCGWERDFVVTRQTPMPDCVLNPNERQWLITCIATWLHCEEEDISKLWNAQVRTIMKMALASN